jgi:hypothetical protein
LSRTYSTNDPNRTTPTSTVRATVRPEAATTRIRTVEFGPYVVGTAAPQPSVPFRSTSVSTTSPPVRISKATRSTPVGATAPTV